VEKLLNRSDPEARDPEARPRGYFSGLSPPGVAGKSCYDQAHGTDHAPMVPTMPGNDLAPEGWIVGGAASMALGSGLDARAADSSLP